MTPIRIFVVANTRAEADWIVQSVGDLEGSGFVLDSVLVPDAFLARDLTTLRGIVIVDTSIGLESSQSLLFDVLQRHKALPVVICVDGAERGDFSTAVRFGAQDFLIRDVDSAEVVHRVLLHALDRSEILRAVQESEENVRTIIENISDGIMIVDEGDTILYANPACEKLLDRPLTDLMGAPLELEIPSAAEAIVEIPHHDESIVRASVRWVPIQWEGRKVRLYMIRDISAEYETQQQLKRARDEAERLAAMKSSFLANMSHELRMPLASIIGFAQLIEEATDNQDHREFSGMIIESGNRLLSTITSVLDLTRLDAQAFDMRRRNVSLGVVVQEVVDGLKPLFDAKGLSVNISSIEEDWILADPIVLQRIFNNVVGNAVKFTDDGGVSVSISSHDEFVVCDVSDTGIGIEPAFLAHVFDQFAQGSTGPGRLHEGSGLGLSITQKLVESIGGDIQVASELGKGSTFTIRFPRNIQTDPHHSGT